MSNTPRVPLKFWPAGADQAESPQNDNLLLLDAVAGMSVKSATTAAEVGSPASGDIYILPASPTGTHWAGKATGTIAQYFDGTWYFYAPWRGLLAEAQDTGKFYFYKTSWVRLETLLPNRQTSMSDDYTLVADDANGHILHPSADTTARTATIPANSSVPYPIGTLETFVNQNGAGVLSIAITTDTLRLAGSGATGTRTLAANGIATALKITSTEWIISGTGLT